MQHSVTERLKIAVDKVTNGNLKEFSKRAGIPYRTLQSYVADEREPGASKLLKIATQLYISIDWLLTGEGEMYRQAEAVKAEAGSVAEKILIVLKDMPEDDQREILKHIEREKQISDLLGEEKKRKSAG